MTATHGQIAPTTSRDATPSERTKLARRLPRDRRRYALDRHARPFVGKPTASDLQTVRGAAGLSITEIAEAIGVQPRTAGRMLKGEASLSPMQFSDVLRLASHKAPAVVEWLNMEAGPEWYRRHLVVDRSKPGQVEIGFMPA